MDKSYQEPSATVYCGHALDLKELPPESVDMCMTSPPYWGLRSYHTEPQIWDSKDGCRHDWVTETFKQHAGRGDCQSSKKYSAQEPVPDMKLDRQFCSVCNAWRGELGLEPRIEMYIDHLIQIFNEVKRVLKKTGTCWVVIDDSYAGSGSPGGDFRDGKGGDDYLRPYNRKGLPAKSLCLIPSRFALAMVENGWILRNDIVWNKPNPMPESVKDRFTGSWEHLFFFVKSKRYFFEQQFEPMMPESESRYHYAFGGAKNEYLAQTDNQTVVIGMREPSLGRNKRDVWEINTQPYPEAHFATFPEKLCETPILAGCPSMICKKCGKAREKGYKTYLLKQGHQSDKTALITALRSIENLGRGNDRVALRQISRAGDPQHIDKGYTDCGCNAGFEPGVVLDPFSGSGTTLAVAKRLGRKAIGIDINPDYCKLAVKRLQEIPMSMELV